MIWPLLGRFNIVLEDCKFEGSESFNLRLSGKTIPKRFALVQIHTSTMT